LISWNIPSTVAGSSALALGAQDLLRRGGLRALVRVEELLVQLLPRRAGPTTSIAMSPRGAARELDHVARELHDRHRLAHVEHEDLAAGPERSRADDELHRLRDRHEVARHRSSVT
jgi:hypothetical protein